MTNETSYILRGVNPQGEEFWYTGRAGEAWVSRDRREAFTYPGFGLSAARDRAKGFNRRVALHGLWFIAVPYFPVK